MRNYLLAIALLATTLSYSQEFIGLGGVRYLKGEWSLSWLEYKMDSGTYIAHLSLDKRNVENLYRDIVKISKMDSLIGLNRPNYSIESFTDGIVIYNLKRESLIVPRGMELNLLIRDIKRSITVM